MSLIAIDFGNSNTVVAYWNVITNQPETLILPQVCRPHPQSFLIPSLVYLRNTEYQRASIGQQVINSGNISQSSRFFDQIKRSLSFATGFVPEIDGIKVSPELAGKIFLNQIFEQLRSQQIHPVEIIFTVPVQSYERYLYWLDACAKDILSNLQTSRIRTIDEPTAAALGYAIHQPGTLVLVIDFGGGTLDLALVRTPKNVDPTTWGNYVGEGVFQQAETQVEVVAKTGQVLGGEDINRWLVEEWLETTDIKIDLNTIHSGHILMSLVEKIKITLSSAESATEVFFDTSQLQAYDIHFSREQLEQILSQRGFFRAIKIAIDEVVHRAFSKGILKMDIKHILLVGGSTLIPAVRALISDYFQQATILTGKPFEAVAHGALMLYQGVQVRDYLFHSYAIRCWQGDQQSWYYQPLFLKGQTYPTHRPYELILRASQADQNTIELVIGELEKRVAGSAEITFDGERIVTMIDEQGAEIFVPLVATDEPQAIAKLDPLGQPGSDRLKVLFSINERRQLLITVIDLLTDKQMLVNKPVADLR